MAIGYLALRQEDQGQAWELIEEAAALLTPLTERLTGRWGGSENAVAAARLALVAQEVEYPDVQRLVTLALMLRPPRPRQVSGQSPTMYNFGDVAAALVWTDAEAARALLEPAIASPEAFADQHSWHWEKALRTMAAADPAWAAMEMRELVATRTYVEPRQRWHWNIELARFLALTRDEQIRESIDGWMPGKWQDE